MRHPRLGRFAVLFGAAGAVTLAIAGPAEATTTTTDIHLNPGQKGKTAATFENSCDQVPGGQVAGIDGGSSYFPATRDPW
jgi:hypothetical protein